MGGHIPPDALRAVLAHPALSGETEAARLGEDAPDDRPGDVHAASEAAFEALVAGEARALG